MPKQDIKEPEPRSARMIKWRDGQIVIDGRIAIKERLVLAVVCAALATLAGRVLVLGTLIGG